MRLTRRGHDQSGVALITAMLALMLVSALMAGMFAAIQSDQRGAAIDRDQTQAYAAAHAGLEQMTSNLASLFVADVSPSVAQINAVATQPPTIPGFEFRAPGGASGSGYAITFTPDANGNPQAIPNADVTTGPFTGFKGLITPYTMTITARSMSGGSEVRLRRGLQTVAIPVFQFGVFSDSDLSIFAGGGYNFGGRVHTNGSLYLAAQTSSNIVFADRLTAVNEVIRNYMSNGLLNSGTAPSFNGSVYIPTSPSTNAIFTQSPNAGSVATMPGSTPNPNWTTISKTTFKSYVLNGATGAKRLDLPLVSQGAQPVDLIRRPALGSDEHNVAPLVYAQRFYAQAGLRILLSDRVADFTTLPTITANAPVLLNGVDGAGGNWTASPPAGYGPVDATHPPIARSIGPATATTVAGSVYTSGTGLTQVYVASMPNVFRLPDPLTLRSATGNTVNITCRGKTGQASVASAGGSNVAIAANAFIGCNVPSLPAGGAPYTIRASVDSRTVVANVNGTPAVSSNATITTVVANETAPFSPGLIWMNNPNATVANTAVPISCEGYTESISGSSIRFLNCRGLSAAPGSNQVVTTSALSDQNTGTIGGYIKIERQDAAGTWTDVTMEILNLGIGDRNSGGTLCNDPTPDAVLRIQRLRDNGGGTCTYNNSQNSWDWWPQGLYDAREGYFRDSSAVAGLTTAPMQMSGVIQYIALDMRNLKRWLAGEIGTTGNQVWNNNGYIVYFSDRRGNHDTANGDVETGEWGFEDFVNPTSADGTPDAVLQAGEDVNIGDPRYPVGSQQLYGGVPWNDPVHIPTGASGIYSFAGTRPTTVIPLSNSAGGPGAGAARVNKVLLFRRALKLVNGGIESGVNNLPTAGITVAAENPVYVHGNYNATHTVTPNSTWSNQEPNVSAAIIADAISILSRNWSDARSFESPQNHNGRPALTTAYRFAALAGKGLSFTYCAAACGNPGSLFGTDGGAANFLRMMEDWGSSSADGNNQQTTHYRGSIVSLHVNRQATGTYKFTSSNNILYNAGSRNFTFDIDFLTPALLPPGTPMFRDVNTLQFRQILRPNQ
ncbi:MAG: hypothetical protein AB7N65_05105 [Vicinamibacterales bacterium]